jgi:translation initiation factor 2 subunit 1
MRKAEAVSTEHTEIKMKLVAPPLYVLTTQTLDVQEGLSLLTKACSVCKEVMGACRGKLVMKHEPRIVSAQEDRLLDEQMENLGKANTEVDGDDDADEEADDFEDGISGPVVEE